MFIHIFINIFLYTEEYFTTKQYITFQKYLNYKHRFYFLISYLTSLRIQTNFVKNRYTDLPFGNIL